MSVPDFDITPNLISVLLTAFHLTLSLSSPVQSSPLSSALCLEGPLTVLFGSQLNTGPRSGLLLSGFLKRTTLTFTLE
jgi:hypothetical protein